MLLLGIANTHVGFIVTLPDPPVPVFGDAEMGPPQAILHPIPFFGDVEDDVVQIFVIMQDLLDVPLRYEKLKLGGNRECVGKVLGLISGHVFVSLV